MADGMMREPRPAIFAHSLNLDELTAPVPSLDPSAAMRLIIDSERLYRFASLPTVSGARSASFHTRMWPGAHESFEVPTLTTDDEGRSRLIDEPAGEAAFVERMEAAEVHYRAKRFDDAAEGYQRAIELRPDSYLVELYTGDALLFGRFPRAALGHYRRATELNPIDHRSHYFTGNALLVTGRHEEALEAYVRALALRPRHAPMLEGLHNRAPRLGAEVLASAFSSNAVAQRLVDGSVLIEHLDRPHWQLYGACKALWLGEASHREETLGRAAPPRAASTAGAHGTRTRVGDGWSQRFSALEERQCLELLARTYRAQRAGGKVPAEEQLEHLLEVIEDGLLSAFVAFELQSRRHPHVIALLPEELRAQVERYVREHLIRRRERPKRPVIERVCRPMDARAPRGRANVRAPVALQGGDEPQLLLLPHSGEPCRSAFDLYGMLSAASPRAAPPPSRSPSLRRPGSGG